MTLRDEIISFQGSILSSLNVILTMVLVSIWTRHEAGESIPGSGARENYARAQYC